MGYQGTTSAAQFRTSQPHAARVDAPQASASRADATSLKAMKILILEDEDAQVMILKAILRREGFTHVTVLQDSRRAAEVFQELQPDLLLLDLNMPHKSGFEVIETLRPGLDNTFPILMLTADARPEVKRQALANGAKDFLNKPFDSTEVILRVCNLLEARACHQKLAEKSGSLEAQVAERTKQLEQTQIEMLVRLARASEYRDDQSGEHVWRVSQLSAQVATEMGLEQSRVEMLLRASRLHDVGKIAIPDGILMKPSRLTKEEFDVIKTHTTVGAKLLSGGQSPLMKLAETIALTHHERFDGCGYPHGLAGEEIPLESRIVAVADTLDAITHDRVHQRSASLAEAAKEIKKESGKQFDPEVVAAFLRVYERGEVVISAPSGLS